MNVKNAYFSITLDFNTSQVKSVITNTSLYVFNSRVHEAAGVLVLSLEHLSRSLQLKLTEKGQQEPGATGQVLLRTHRPFWTRDFIFITPSIFFLGGGGCSRMLLCSDNKKKKVFRKTNYR